MSRPLLACIVLPALCLFGCETTGDPNQGGYFGWSEEKAQERQDELLRQYEAEQAELGATEAERARLNANRSSLQSELLAQQRENDFLRADIGTRTKLLKSLESLDQEKQRRLGELERDLQATDAPGRDPAQVKRELEALQRELQMLESSSRR